MELSPGELSADAPRLRKLRIAAILVSLVVSCSAALRGGYVGSDYMMFFERLTDPSKILDFSWVHPPLYFAFGNALLVVTGRSEAFPVTLAIIQAIINAWAMWWFLGFIEPRFRSGLTHLAFALVVIFLPVRVIYTTAVGTDWMTVPVFVLLLYLCEKLLSVREGYLRYAAMIGGVLCTGIWSKYSFVAIFPALLAIFIIYWRRAGWSFGRFIATSVITLAAASVLLLYSFDQSKKANSFGTQIWLPEEGAPGQPDMDFVDLVTVKASDARLFAAPEMFMAPEPGQAYNPSFRTPHNHSYLALAHMGTFTDYMNVFQDLDRERHFGEYLIPDFKTRRPWRTFFMQDAMLLGVFWTLIGIIAVPLAVLRSVKRLVSGDLEREDILALLATHYFLLLYLSIPFVYYGMLNAYWAPRLMLIPIIFIATAIFMFIDRYLVQRRPALATAIVTIAGLQAVASATFLF